MLPFQKEDPIYENLRITRRSKPFSAETADVRGRRQEEETGSKHRLSCVSCTIRVADRLAVNLCPGRDSNPHDLAITNT